MLDAQLAGELTGLNWLGVKRVLDGCHDDYVRARNRQLKDRPNRRRLLGGGSKKPKLHPLEVILMGMIWMRHHPTSEALGELFGVSDSTVGRLVKRIEPILAKTDYKRFAHADAGRKRRPGITELRATLPALDALFRGSKREST